MKRTLRAIAIAACLPVALGAVGCGGAEEEKHDPGECVMLAEAANAGEFTYADRTSEEFVALRDASNTFGASFTGAAYAAFGDKTANLAVSPVSAYLALGLAAESTTGTMRSELLSALGTDYAGLTAGYSKLYNALSARFYAPGGAAQGQIELSNSVWINAGTQADETELSRLAESFYCYAYSADFKYNNTAANAAVREFVRTHTHNRIDRDFGIKENTVFSLINALYVKDVWNEHGDDIALSDSRYLFAKGDGTEVNTRLMTGSYISGRKHVDELFTSFYTTTENGITLSFLLPNAGVPAEQAFSAQSFDKLGKISYITVDHDRRETYSTRCIFPKFKAEFDQDVKDVLKNEFGVRELFNSQTADISNITGRPAYCTAVKQVANLDVDRKGIEGAAVTVIEMADSSMPWADDYEEIFEDLVVDRAFGYTLSYNGITLFAGVVNSPNVL